MAPVQLGHDSQPAFIAVEPRLFDELLNGCSLERLQILPSCLLGVDNGAFAHGQAKQVLDDLGGSLKWDEMCHVKVKS